MNHLRWRASRLSVAGTVLWATTIVCSPPQAAAQQAAANQGAARPERPPQDAVLSDDTVPVADVPYGDDPAQRVDVYSFRGASHAPVVLFVHGGEWTRHDKSEVSYKPKFFNEHGVVFVSVNYRLTPHVVHPAHVQDVASAIRWVHDHIGDYGGDPRKIVLMGHSAGCHLVTLVALDPQYLAKVRLKPADLRGVVAWSGGSYDLVQKVEERGRYADYIRKAFGESESTWREASPVNHVREVKEGPAFLFVSIEPGNASHQAAERMVGLIRDAGGNATSRMLEGRDHFGANHYFGAPDDTTGAIFLEFVNDVTK